MVRGLFRQRNGEFAVRSFRLLITGLLITSAEPRVSARKPEPPRVALRRHIYTKWHGKDQETLDRKLAEGWTNLKSTCHGRGCVLGLWALASGCLRIHDSVKSPRVLAEPSPENIPGADAGVEEDGLELDQDEVVLRICEALCTLACSCDFRMSSGSWAIRLKRF